jgi:hypothetical protein
MFWALSNKLQLVVAGALVLAILTGGSVVYQSIRRSGMESAERAIAKDNANAVTKANEERKRRERECAVDLARCLSDEWTRQP